MGHWILNCFAAGMHVNPATNLTIIQFHSDCMIRFDAYCIHQLDMEQKQVIYANLGAVFSVLSSLILHCR